MSGRGDSSLSQGSEIPKETEKKVKDLVRRLSNEYNRSKDGPSPTNYPEHIGKAKADEYLIAVKESWKSNTADINQKYREEAKNIEGNSNREIIAKQGELARDHMDQQAKLEKFQRALRDDLRKRSE